MPCRLRLSFFCGVRAREKKFQFVDLQDALGGCETRSANFITSSLLSFQVLVHKSTKQLGLCVLVIENIEAAPGGAARLLVCTKAVESASEIIKTHFIRSLKCAEIKF